MGILGWLSTKPWWTVTYASHSELTRQKPKDIISTKKTRAVDLKIQKKSALPA